MHYLQTHVELHSGVSPTGERLESGTYFVASPNWYRERQARRTISEVEAGEYWRAVVRGESATHEPDEAPERFRSEVSSSATEPDDPELSEADKVEAARERLDDHEDELRADLPEEEPTEDAPTTTRIVWALLKGGYQDRRSVVADVSDESAMQGDEALRKILLAALYDREMVE